MGQIVHATQADIALSAATAKTVIQVVAAANHGVKIASWSVFFEGVAPTNESVAVRLLRQTTSGTMTSLTLRKNDDSNGDTIDTTAQHTATAEPSAGDVLKQIRVHPQTGYEEQLPFGQEYVVGAGDRIGIECTAPDANQVTANIRIIE